MAVAKSASLASSLTTGRSLILLQLLSRLLTFGLNQALVRLAPPEVFGTASIQFDLLAGSILFLSREGIRNALLRSRGSSKGEDDVATTSTKQRQADALAIVPFYLGLVVSAALTAIYLYTLPKTTSAQTDFYPSLGLYILSALVELLIEPLYIRALRAEPPNMRVRLQAEGGMAIVKAVCTVAAVLALDKVSVSRPPGLLAAPRGQRALLAFAVGQIAGSAWLAARYFAEYGLDGIGWLDAPDNAPRFDPDMTSLAIANTRQSVIKHLLTEADRIAVGRLCKLEEQGGYAVAMNYGSLVARIIFQPLEETLLLHFTSSLASESTPRLLSTAIHLSSHLLLLVPAFLPPLLPAILPILLPRRYHLTSAPATLQTYLMAYIPLLSLNGILEAFHAASATPQQVKTQAKWMIGSSAVFVACLAVLSAGSSGMQKEQVLIWASCAAMVVRIAYAYLHAKRYFTITPGGSTRDRPSAQTQFSLRQLAPRTPVWAAVIASGIALRGLAKTGRWQSSTRGWLELVGVGAVMGIVNLGITAFVERKQLRPKASGKAE